MPNYTLLNCTAEQLLGEPANGDQLIYEEDVPTLGQDGKINKVHHQMTRGQAHAIMRKIVNDDIIIQALKDSIEFARLNPLGNMPVNGAHPVDPAVKIIKERAIRPVLDKMPPGDIALQFVSMAYDRLQRRA